MTMRNGSARANTRKSASSLRPSTQVSAPSKSPVTSASSSDGRPVLSSSGPRYVRSPVAGSWAAATLKRARKVAQEGRLHVLDPVSRQPVLELEDDAVEVLVAAVAPLHQQGPRRHGGRPLALRGAAGPLARRRGGGG